MSEYDWKYEFKLLAWGGCTLEKLTISGMRKLLPPCPICGKKAYLDHSIVDGFDFGWDVGCPSYCLNDGVHGITESYDPEAPHINSWSAELAFKGWIDYCERKKKNGRSDDFGNRTDLHCC